jgi:hypothetical protein
VPANQNKRNHLGSRVWFLSAGKRREGVLLTSDDLSVNAKEDSQALPERTRFLMLSPAQQRATSHCRRRHVKSHNELHGGTSEAASTRRDPSGTSAGEAERGGGRRARKCLNAETAPFAKKLPACSGSCYSPR